jgi:exosortase
MSSSPATSSIIEPPGSTDSATEALAGLPRRSSAWVRGGLWGLLGGTVAAVIASDAWLDLWNIGTLDEESSHVLLAPAMFAWLFWIRRKRLNGLSMTGRWLGAALIGVGWLLWAVGYRYQFQVFWHGGAVVMVLGGVLTGLGEQVFWKFLAAFGALVFVVPVPGVGRQMIALPLQRITAQATQRLSETLGVLVERSGSLLTLNGREIAIVEACNGMRMVFTLLMACYVFAFILPLRPWVRVLILVVSPVVAIVANVIRLVPTVWMYGNASVESAKLFHDASGWAMLIVAFLSLLGMVKVLDWATVPVLSRESDV